MARIGEYLIEQTADEISELAESVIYSKGGSKRYAASELLEQAAELIREADKLIKESDDEEA